MKRTASVVGCALALLVLAPPAPAAARDAERVVIVTLPGVTWFDIIEADTPILDRLTDRGAAAALSVRTAIRPSVPERAYLTLGAGNRGQVRQGDAVASEAYRADEVVGAVSASDALRTIVGSHRSGAVVHLGIAQLHAMQETRLFGTRTGSLGEALARAGIPTGVVSAGDLALEPRPDQRRRAVTLTVVDEQGTIDHGAVDGLLTADPSTPFGVRTDETAFRAAVRQAVGSARVVAVEPGETLRADEFSRIASPEQAVRHKEEALERADALVGVVASELGPRDVLIVAAVSGPLNQREERLTAIVAHGQGFEGGRLVSPTTRRDGIVGLIDIAPTVLGLLGVEKPESMSGSAMRATGESETDKAAALHRLNRQSVFREAFSDVVFVVFVAAQVALAALAFVAFLRRQRWALAALPWLACTILAMPSATLMVRLVDVSRFGHLVAHLMLWTLVAALTIAAQYVPGPRWAGGVLLLGLTTLSFGADLLTGAHLQTNAVFGHSPIVAGRFYGVANAGFGILASAGILALMGIVDLRGRTRAPYWAGAGLLVLVALVGLPPFGANFGGLITTFFAVCVTWLLARYGRVRWRVAVAVAAAAIALAVVVSLVDMTRPAVDQTHLGRFASSVVQGGLPALVRTVLRKGLASVGTLGFTGWTYIIPVSAAVIALLVYKPRGVLRDVIPRHPVLRAGLWGTVVVGVVGFALNDSGVVLPGVAIAHAAPLLVLMGVETVSPTARPAAAAAVERAPVEP
ncbi:MAG TPA: hypothetical protein VM840_00525 [Actinomycetota bacterium]|nr:hypothetical protein [Actinomycetota bacterium]